VSKEKFDFWGEAFKLSETTHWKNYMKAPKDYAPPEPSDPFGPDWPRSQFTGMNTFVITLLIIGFVLAWWGLLVIGR